MIGLLPDISDAMLGAMLFLGVAAAALLSKLVDVVRDIRRERRRRRRRGELELEVRLRGPAWRDHVDAVDVDREERRRRRELRRRAELERGRRTPHLADE